MMIISSKNNEYTNSMLIGEYPIKMQFCDRSITCNYSILDSSTEIGFHLEASLYYEDDEEDKLIYLLLAIFSGIIVIVIIIVMYVFYFCFSTNYRPTNHSDTNQSFQNLLSNFPEISYPSYSKGVFPCSWRGLKPDSVPYVYRWTPFYLLVSSFVFF